MFRALLQYITLVILRWVGWFMRRRLEDATRHVQEAQHATLMEKITENVATEYGEKYDFAKITSREDFVRQHPLTRYSHYEPYIHSMMRGQKNVMTASPIVRFGVTSGTSGRSSCVPLVKKQMSSFFLHGFSILYYCMTKAFSGTNSMQKYLKLLYSARPRTSECGIPVGPNSSTPANSKRMLSLYTTPKAGYSILTEQDALYIHLLFGLKEKNLGIIEANFATLIYTAFKALEANWELLVVDIANGTVGAHLHIDNDVRDELNKCLVPNPKRAKEIRAAFAGGTVGLAKRIWPNLNLILTVDSGSMRLYGEKLEKVYCFGVPIYSPVYAATEGLLGINIWPQERPSRYLLLPYKIFFEMIPVEHSDEDQPKTVFMENVQVGKCYELVITNAGGLYRYRFGDVVKVIGFHNTCPVIEFQYRMGQLLNVRGEKTSEAALFDALKRAVERAGVTLVDYTCAESVMLDELSGPAGSVPCYHVFLELEDCRGTEEITVDEELMSVSYVYSSFRLKGSIGPMVVHKTKPGTFSRVRSHIIHVKNTSPTQYKTPRVVKSADTFRLLMENVITDIVSSKRGV